MLELAHEILSSPTRCSNGWCTRLPDDEWRVYQRIIALLEHHGVPFALGGAFALATYTGQWRNTKDIDLYVEPSMKERTVQILLDEGGLTDLHIRLPYDRMWIFRGEEDGTIVDVIWALANQVASVDREWLTKGPRINVRGHTIAVIPAEELMWAKLYVLQRERCDWPDVLNILYFTCDILDWNRFLTRFNDDVSLLGAALKVFEWLCPERAGHIPGEVWEEVLRAEHSTLNVDRERVRRLDSRPWFRPIHEL